MLRHTYIACLVEVQNGLRMQLYPIQEQLYTDFISGSKLYKMWHLGKSENHKCVNKWGLEISACELKCSLLAVRRADLQISLRLRKCAKGRASCLPIGRRYCLCHHFISYI